MSRHTRPTRIDRTKLVCWALVVPLSAASTTILVEAATAGASPSATVHGSVPGCAVTLHFSPTSVTAVIDSGCTGSGYYLSSWSAPSDIERYSRPQTLYAMTSAAPWTVALPPCFWQVDFAQRSAPPGQPATLRHLIAAQLGGMACTTTTTTRPTTTTLPSTTTTVPVTTTVPQTTTTLPTTTTSSSTTTVVTTPTTVPATTLPPTPPPSSQGSAPLGTATTVATAQLLQQSAPLAAPARPVTQAGRTLPFTGADSELLGAVGLVVLATGGVLVAGARRRRRSA